MKSHRDKVRIVVSCISDTASKVFLEPWGTEYEIAPGEHLTFVIQPNSDGRVDVAYGDGGITIDAMNDTNPAVIDDYGNRLAI